MNAMTRSARSERKTGLRCRIPSSSRVPRFEPGRLVMKDQETIQRFIQLRAAGWSFARIAGELKVSKPTLIQWSRRHQFEIQNLRAVETEALAEKCFSSRSERWEQIGRDLRRVEAELAKRDLGDVPTARLLSLAAKLRSEASRETAPLRLSTAVRDIPDDERFECVLDWQV
jgi:hypothetical protein